MTLRTMPPSLVLHYMMAKLYQRYDTIYLTSLFLLLFFSFSSYIVDEINAFLFVFFLSVSASNINSVLNIEIHLDTRMK